MEDDSVSRIEIKIENLGKNSRKIKSRVVVNATLETIWSVLTNYEKLVDFIPGLAVSRLVERKDNFARLFQLGHHELAFGLKFNAKGLLDCYEREVKSLPSGISRDIDFKMVEGDFQIFEGKWSIEQNDCDNLAWDDEGGGDTWLADKAACTTLSYEVVVKPKSWLPVGLVKGRICKEIEVNLSCIREEAQKFK